MPRFSAERVSGNAEVSVTPELREWIEGEISKISDDVSIPEPVRKAIANGIAQEKAHGNVITNLRVAPGGEVSDSGLVTKYPPTGKYNPLHNEATHLPYWGLIMDYITPEGRIGETAFLLKDDGTNI